MMTRLRAAVTGLAALAILAAVVVGLPLILYRFGGPPLPRRQPGLLDLARRLASRDDGGAALAVIRDCAWLAWLLFTACVLAEAQAAVRGSRAPRLWLGGMQGAAAQLVALAALTFSVPASIALPAAGTQLVALDSMTTPDNAATSLTITVHSGDCLWSIAQRYLGAGDRYPEIAALNYGHPMGDGDVFTDPSIIRPGWRLLLPADIVAAPAPPAARPSAGPHAGHVTADPHYKQRHRTADIQKGNGVATPGGTASTTAVAPGSARTDQVAVSRPLTEHAGALPAIPETAVFVTGALAGAILTSLTRLRFRQRQARRRGRRIALPADAAVLAAEQRLHTAVPGESIETLRHALACLETGLLAVSQQLPDIVGLHVTPDQVEVLLTSPAADAPPAPYEVSPGRQGMCWQLTLPARASPETPCHLLPGLVTVGATTDGYLLLDLESLQVTGCDGPPDLVDQVVSTIATELATGQWSNWYELILVGCDELASLGRAEHCDTLDEALSMLEECCARTAERVAERGPADLRELRLADPNDEDWGLTILVSRTEPSAYQLTRLLDLAVESWGGLAVLVAGDAEAADGRMAPAVLQLAPDPHVPDGIVANVAPLQITVRPRALSGEEYDAIALLFRTAADISDVAPDDVPYAAYGAPPWIPGAAALRPGTEQPTASADQPDGGEQPDDDPLVLVPGQLSRETEAHPLSGGHLDIQILGPLVIAGAAEQLQPQQAELVLALALAAPGGLSNSALCSTLGADPDHPKPSDAVRQIIMRTRRRLGRASDGRELIIHAGNGQYLLHPEASLDWSRFRELTRSGRAVDLRAALDLVRGEPFTGSYFWWIDIPLIETVRAEIVDAAETLAEFELVAGAPRAAARAARAGLAAEPCAEQLWRAVMRAEHAGGNQAGVTEAWRRCLDAIEDIAPGGEPHHDTAALYRQLTTTTPEHARMR